MVAMGRPRKFDRDFALTAAMRLFWARGYTASTTSELCRVMEISSPSLYATFSSKEALYVECLKLYGQFSQVALWKPFDCGATARRAFEGLFNASVLAFSAPEAPHGCMLALSSAANEGNETLGDVLKDLRAANVRRLVARLERGVVEGDVPAVTDLETVARFYLSLHQGMSIQARDGASRAELQTIADRAIDIWPALVS